MPHKPPPIPDEAPLTEAMAAKISQAAAPLEEVAQATKPGFLGKLGKFGKFGKIVGVAGATGLALGAVDLLLNPAGDFVSGVADTLNPSRVDQRLERMISGQEKVEQLRRLQAKKAQKVQELMQRNTLLLAQNAPHLFNQLMAGRTLPQGATVIGGQPRTDLVQQVAMGMAQGRFAPPQEGQLPLGGE